MLTTIALGALGALGVYAAGYALYATSVRRHRAYVPRYRPGSPSAMRALTRADEQFNERSAGMLKLLHAWHANDTAAAGQRPALRVLPRGTLRGTLRVGERLALEATGEFHTEGATMKWSPLATTNAAGQSLELMTPVERERAEVAHLLDPFNAALDAALLRFQAAIAPVLDKTERWVDELDPSDWFRQWRIDTDTAGWPLVQPSAMAAALLLS
jgi:hypothetical protein